VIDDRAEHFDRRPAGKHLHVVECQHEGVPRGSPTTGAGVREPFRTVLPGRDPPSITASEEEIDASKVSGSSSSSPSASQANGRFFAFGPLSEDSSSCHTRPERPAGQAAHRVHRRDGRSTVHAGRALPGAAVGGT
jgi:hypothetical protein